MLIREGEDRTTAVDLSLAVSLATVAGALNAAAFRAVGYFSANMTGNVSLMSEDTAVGNLALAATFLVIVLAFILGSFTSTLLIQVGRRRTIHGVFAYSILTEGVLLALLGIADILLPAVHSTPLLVVGLGFLMGVQNATSTLISEARVRTTHVSGIATDLGIELALFIARSGTEQDAVRSRFVLHATTLFAFLVGGIAGVVGYVAVGSWVFLILAALLVGVALLFVRPRRAKGV